MLLKRYVHEGWPAEKQDVHELVKMYFPFQDEITETENIFFKGEKIIIPMLKRKEVMKLLHQSHIGLQSTLKRARETVYWPGITRDI